LILFGQILDSRIFWGEWAFRLQKKADDAGSILRMDFQAEDQTGGRTP
jgi:hypothetical protein